MNTGSQPMSWEMLVVLTILTFGIAPIIGAFRQTMWAKRVDPGNTATIQLTGIYVLPFVSTILETIASTSYDGSTFLAMSGLLNIFVLVLVVMYVLSMLKTIRSAAQFNAVPLQPSTFLGFVLSVFYFQHCIRTIEAHCQARRAARHA